ncbi:glycosyltransferase family 2 protein [Alteromonas sp. D210916BOD_24]|uniref:glycosyltransferase family 2 protein n=1 Tax=Alteromonas sp. D210916BOD_24 TaxID=3157618 RepID=UPI00399CBF83
MKINAIMLVKNEVDIVEETLLNAMKFCHKIYIYDNQSTDGTWELVNEMASRFSEVVIFGQTAEPYKNQLRNRVYNEHHGEYSDHDWWYILDSDELLTESPAKQLSKAAAKNKNAMCVWQAQFYFTDEDLANYEEEDVSASITQRRKHYLINWKEQRFFKNESERKWPESLSGRIPPWSNKMASYAPVCRHYALRTPEQIQARVALRMKTQHGFAHIKRAPEINYPSASTLDVYNNDGVFKIRWSERIKYVSKQMYFAFHWKWKAVTNILLSSVKKKQFQCKSL